MRLLVGRYILVKQIGKGGFGAVEEYTDDISKENVAIKTIPARYVNQESRRLVREIDIMCFLHSVHPHVIGYYSIFATRGAAVPNHNARDHDDPLASTAQTPENTAAELNVVGPRYAGMSTDERSRHHHEALTAAVAGISRDEEFNVHIVMPLMKGDLFYFIRLLSSKTGVAQLGLTHQYLAQVAIVFAFQICFGLDYLHQCAIIHRDMKPDNVLVRLDINNPYMSTAVIADMGLARDAQHSDTIYICTRYYRPPEVITSVSGGSSKIDIWSLGCIFYEMCTGQTLFTMRTALNDRGEWDGAKASLQLEVILNTIGTPAAADIELYMPRGNARLYLQRSAQRPSQLRQLVENNWILQTGPDEKEQWIDLITRCVAFFPEQRPTAQQLCEHKLFRDHSVLYGENVIQYAARPYTPSFRSTPESSRVENKQSILALVRRVLQETTPVVNEEDSSSDEGASVTDSDSSSNSSDTSSSSGSTNSSSDEDDPQPPFNETFDISLSTQHRGQSNSAFNPTGNYNHNGENKGNSTNTNTNANSIRDVNEESESGGTTSLFGISKSTSGPVVGGKSAMGGTARDPGAAAAVAAAQSGPALLPRPTSHSTDPHATSAFLDDDNDDGAGGDEEPEGQRYLRVDLSPGPQHHFTGEPGSRLSPGNGYRNSPIAMIGKAMAARPQPARPVAHSASSEDSGPVIDDTPPLAPVLAFKDRITRRRHSDEEEPNLGGAKPSVFNLENYQRADNDGDPYDNEEQVLAESVVPHALPIVAGPRAVPRDSPVQGQYGVALDRGETPPLPLTKVGPYSYTSQYTVHRPESVPPSLPAHPQPNAYYFGGMEGSTSTSLPRPGGSAVKRRIGDAGVHTTSAAALSAPAPRDAQADSQGVAKAEASRRTQEEQYDYFGDADYFISPSSSNVAKVAGALTKEPNSSMYLVQLADSGRAPRQQPAAHFAKSAVAQPPTRPAEMPPLPRVMSASFPLISNAELRQRYMAFRHSPRSIQSATSAVLEEMGSCTHDPERSSELRELLHYFSSLKMDTTYSI